MTLADSILALVRRGTTYTLREVAVLLGCLAEPQTVRGLAGALAIPRPSVTRSADRLCADGLLQREPDPEDRRSVLLCLTPAGRRYARGIG